MKKFLILITWGIVLALTAGFFGSINPFIEVYCGSTYALIFYEAYIKDMFSGEGKNES